MKYFKPFTPPVVPDFPDRIFDIRDFGATEGERSSKAINDAIKKCSESGGGRVVIPRGRWLTGPVHLRDNVELHISEGALVEFSTEFSDYLPVVYGILAGNRVYSVSHFIYAYRCKNIALTGKGVLDGHGEAWWYMKKHQPGMEDLIKKGKALAPLSERVYDRPEDGVRPRMLQFVECENVLLSDVTLKNSPSWTVHLAWCENIIARALTIENPQNAPNTDGMNFEYCRRAVADGCVISGGDDMCCIKAGRDTDAWESGRPCEDIEIKNCRAVNCSEGGITIGSETSASIRNIYIHDCRLEMVKSGFNLKTMKGRGGTVENIDAENIVVDHATLDAIRINMRFEGEPLDDYSQPDLNMPKVRNLHIENFVCKKTISAFTVRGVKNHKIENVSIKNTLICAEDYGTVEFVKNFTTENTTVKESER